jgi:hypothetical protein
MIDIKIVEVTSDRGGVVTIRKGDRITWKSPCGLGGAEVSGVFMGGEGHLRGDCVFGIDAEPSESLRKLAGELAVSPDRLNDTLAKIFVGPRAIHKSGLDGSGGVFVVIGEAFEQAMRNGNLTLDPLPKGDQ